MYQYYHHSCSLNVFNNIAKHYYNKSYDKFLLDIEEKHRQNGKSESEIRKLVKKQQGVFIPSIVEREGDFIDRVKKMQDANTAEIEFTTIDFNNNLLQPIQPFLKTLKYKMAFISETSKIEKIKSLVNMLKSQIPKKAKVIGIDEHGHDVAYKLFNDFGVFGEYDYEDMVPSLNLDQAKVANSIKKNKIIGELISVFDNIVSVLS